MNRRITTVIAWLLCAAIIASILFGLAGKVLNRALGAQPLDLAAVIVQSLVPIAFALVGTLILSQQSRNVIGWLLMMPAFAFAIVILISPLYSNLTTAPEDPSLWLYLALYVNGASWVFFIFPLFLIALLFPTGKVLSPRWRWVVALAIGMVGFFLLAAALAARMGPVEGEASWTIPNPIGFITQDTFDVIFSLPWGIGLVTLALLSVLALVLRYRRATAIERQQLKWLLFATGLFAAAYSPAVATSGETAGTTRTILDVLFVSATLAFPIAIGIAILRYRLWDIDVIIRRTVTYAIVVALLLVVYFGSVILLQQIFANLTGERSEVITVLSTLAIAALFVPLRNRVQNAIDKRFNRKKYDAQQVLKKFSETVRDETDLDKLTAELVNVVNETMEPKSVSVWLKSEARRMKDEG